MAKKSKFRPLWHPALWPAWIVRFLLFLLSLLSPAAKDRWGRALGRLLYRRWHGRRKVVERNLNLCFPDMDQAARDQLAVANFEACAVGAMETVASWWSDVTPYLNRLHVKGREHLDQAKARGKGIILIGGHYSIFDLALPMIAQLLEKPGYVYRPNDNPVIDDMIERGRRRHFGIRGFTKHQPKEVLAFLKEGGMVWIAYDQDFGSRGKHFVPFFGVPMNVVDAPTKVVKGSEASVLCVSHLRLPNGDYEVAFSPILEGFGQDPQADAEAWNRCLEASVRLHPDQYLWMHKRFKTRPPGEPKIY